MKLNIRRCRRGSALITAAPFAPPTGREVALWGWVASRRDHGGLIFIDLRDREGIVQLVFNPERDAGAHEVAEAARSEFYVAAKGKVVRRAEGTDQSPNCRPAKSKSWSARR